MKMFVHSLNVNLSKGLSLILDSLISPVQCNTFSMSYLRKRLNDVKSKEELFLFQLQKIVFEIWRRLIG